MSLEQKLNSLKQREKDDLESKIDSLETRYLTMPQKVNRVSSLAGIPPEEFVSICAEIAWHYKDFTWDDIMEIVRSFYVVKTRRETEKEPQS